MTAVQSEDKRPVPLPDPMPLTVERIYAAYEAHHIDRDRPSIGIASFGAECDRQLWYAFRWATPPEAMTGRKLRLFETGHREEERMIADLVDAGVKVEHVDPATGRQWSVEALGGHVRGRLDGIGTGLAEAPAARHVLEFKTHNDKSFKELVKKGVKAAKPAHWRQMNGYMHLTGIARAFYLAHNKNTDELHGERVEYDPVEAAQMMARAERIVTSDTPPPKLHEDPTAKAAFACAWCPARGVCHEREFARTNCRTCLHATANITTGGWDCAWHGRELSDEDQRAGCSAHLYIPDLVPGEQIDADANAATVTYRMPDGSLWVDGRSA